LERGGSSAVVRGRVGYAGILVHTVSNGMLIVINPLNAELNLICHLLALLRVHFSTLAG